MARALRLNTAGLKYGLAIRHIRIRRYMKRYRELGGEIITVGADGHMPEHIAYDYHQAR